MKEKYTAPSVEIIKFDNEDIITSSITNNGYASDDGLNWSPLRPID